VVLEAIVFVVSGTVVLEEPLFLLGRVGAVLPDVVVESIATVPALGRPEHNTMGSQQEAHQREQGGDYAKGHKNDGKNDGKKDGKKDNAKAKGDAGKGKGKGALTNEKAARLLDMSADPLEVEPETLKVGVAGECVKLTLTLPLASLRSHVPSVDLSEHAIVTGFSWACEHVCPLTKVTSSSSTSTLPRCSNMRVQVTVLRGHSLGPGENLLLSIVPHTPSDDAAVLLRALRAPEEPLTPPRASACCAVLLERVAGKAKSRLEAGQHAAVDFSVGAVGDRESNSVVLWLDAEATVAVTSRVALRRTADGCIVAVGIVAACS
jgi:hypothetical protein